MSKVQSHDGRVALDLHRDERGSISLATVFALLLLTILLGMVLNVGRQVDNKVRMQNAADAATYSGGVVLARGMNTVAYSNHLLCEVFALTAILREGRDRHAEPLVPEILAAWDKIAPVLAGSKFEKFSQLGLAIPQKTPLEQEMVPVYSEWVAASSELILPVLEEILANEVIPQFQREVIQATPGMAQAAARIAEQHSGRTAPHDRSRGSIEGVLWRTMIDPVGGESESSLGTLPAVDPQDPRTEWAIRSKAVSERNSRAHHYLGLWNDALLQPFDTEGKMSQFGGIRFASGGILRTGLWRGFTCGQLRELLEENAERNLPHMIREQPPPAGAERNAWMTQNYHFVGVAYRRKMGAAIPRLFGDSLTADNQTFAQGALFIPKWRPVDVGWQWVIVDGVGHWEWYFIGDSGPWRRPFPMGWDLWSQHWSFQLVPVTADSTPSILQQPRAGFRGPVGLSGVSSADIGRVTTH